MTEPIPRIRSVWTSAALGLALVLLGLFFLRFELTIRAPGIVQAREEIRLFAPLDGVITRHQVQLGQTVTNGQLLLALDDTDLSLRALARERDLAETEAARQRNALALQELAIKPGSAELITAGDRRERLSRIAAIQKDIEQNFTNGRELQAISALEVRKQEIERLRSELELLQTSLQAEWQKAGLSDLDAERLQVEQQRLEALAQSNRNERDLINDLRAAMRLTSPLDGQVVALPVRFSGMAVARGAELLKLAATGGPYRVRAYIPERNVDLVQEGTRAIMKSAVFESMLEGYVEGVVVRVAPEGAAENGGEAPRYEVDIDVTQTPYPLVLGSGVEVRLLLGRRPLTDFMLRHGGHPRQPAKEKS
jgi:multidrug resistance efflux pump